MVFLGKQPDCGKRICVFSMLKAKMEVDIRLFSLQTGKNLAEFPATTSNADVSQRKQRHHSAIMYPTQAPCKMCNRVRVFSEQAR